MTLGKLVMLPSLSVPSQLLLLFECTNIRLKDGHWFYHVPHQGGVSSGLDGGSTRVVGVSRRRFFEAHGLPYHYGIEFLRRSLQVLCSGLVGDTRERVFDESYIL